MNKDLRKVVILLAHPNMKGSQANKALIDAVGDIEGVAVFNLYELSPDIAFNVDEWSKIISDASAVIYQFPFYWMSAPSLLKKWQDEVFMRWRMSTMTRIRLMRQRFRWMIKKYFLCFTIPVHWESNLRILTAVIWDALESRNSVQIS